MHKRAKSAQTGYQHKAGYCVCIEVIPVTENNDHLEKSHNSWDAKQVPY